MSCRHGNHYDGCDICDEVDASFEAGRRSALAERLAPAAQQEPVAWANPNDLQNFDMKVRTNGGPLHTIPLYTTPQAQPAREWVGLTEQEFQWIYDHGRTPAGMMEMVEAKIKEKNHD